MIAIRMKFLSGQYHATPWGHHVNEGLVEYPPSLLRLLRALIAVRRRACRAEVSEEQLTSVLQSLRPPPVYHLPPASIGHTRHYDASHGDIRFLDSFVALDPDESIIWFWPENSLDSLTAEALAALLRALNVFGRAESWCETELLSEGEACRLLQEKSINSRPLDLPSPSPDEETQRMLVPDDETPAGQLIGLLEVSTTELRQQRRPTPSGTRWATYTRPAGILNPVYRQAIHRGRGTSLFTVARFSLESTILPRVTDALPFAEQVRRALISRRSAISHSVALVGKTTDGTPLAGHQHAHFLATDEDGEGRLDHLTIFAPGGFNEEDLQAISSTTSILRPGHHPSIRLNLTGLGTPSDLTSIPHFRPALRWRSFTPFSLPRFSRRGSGKASRPRDLPESQLLRELRHRGLPPPLSIQRIDGYAPHGRPLVRWREFQTRRLNGAEGFGLAGFELRFHEPVHGPLALGFGCHFSLGLLLPVD